MTCPGCGRLMDRSDSRATVCMSCMRLRGYMSTACTLLVKAAIELGQLRHIDGQSCVDCGKPAFCYDHRNYYEPLKVEPICRACNRKRPSAFPFARISLHDEAMALIGSFTEKGPNPG